MTRDRMILLLQAEYETRRVHNLAVYEERVNETCDACPGLRTLIDRRRSVLMEGIRSAFYPEEGGVGAAAGVTNATHLERMNDQIKVLLHKNGLSPQALDPVYTCTRCRDEGYVYDEANHRSMCDCFETELNRRMLGELGLAGDHTFENFNPDVFDKDAPSPVSQRQMMLRNRDLCERYADAFPGGEYSDLLFIGQSGLGKTYLMHAVALRVAARGVHVEYISAFKLLEITRRAYFENNPGLLNTLITVPLLLIDDLGTEPLMENITVTQLFNLLNERLNQNRHTVISTNLTIPELKARYTERVTSRLLDESRCRLLKFIGDDVRPMLKKRNA